MLKIYILITRFLIFLLMLILKIGFSSIQYRRSLSLSRNKRYKSKTIHWKKLRNCDAMKINNTSPSFRPVRFPKPQIFVKMFHRNLQSPVSKNAMPMYLCGTPIWRTENSVNIWNFGYLGD